MPLSPQICPPTYRYVEPSVTAYQRYVRYLYRILGHLLGFRLINCLTSQLHAVILLTLTMLPVALQSTWLDKECSGYCI